MVDQIRAKFCLVAITTEAFGQTVLKFETRYDEKTEEDKRFMKATPWGSIEMRVDNPIALEYFKLGEEYYADFTKCQ